MAHLHRYIFSIFLFFSTSGGCQSSFEIEIDSLVIKVNEFRKSNQDSALYYSSLAYEKALKSHDTTLICRVIIDHSSSLIAKTLFDRSEALLRFNLTNERHLGKKLLGLTYFNLGALFQTKQGHDLALENYLSALDYFLEINDHSLLSKTYLYSGVAFQKGNKKNKGEKADYFYDLSLYHSKLAKQGEESTHAPLSKLGAISLEVKIKSCQDALNGIDDPSKSRLAAILNHDMSRNYYTAGRYKKAIEHAKIAVQIKKNIALEQNVDYANFIIGASLVDLNRNADAIPFLNNVINNSHKRSIRIRAIEYLVKAHENREDYKSAFINFQEFGRLKDSISSFQENERIAEIISKFETEKQANEILILEKKNQDKELLIANQKNKMWKWSLFALIATLIAVLLSRKLKSSVKRVKKVEREKEALVKKVEQTSIVLNNKTKVYLDVLKYIRSDGNYIEFFTENEKLIDRNKLVAILRQLPPNFIRIHRSYIVNKNFITSTTSSTVIIKSNIEIPLSRTFKKNLK